MSVINKMLRDLDLRQVGQTVGAAGPSAQPELRQGTASVGFAKSGAARQAPPGLRLWLGVVVLLVLVLVAGGWAWWLNRATDSQTQSTSTTRAADGPLPGTTSAATASAATVVATAPAVVAAASSVTTDSGPAQVIAVAPVSAATPNTAMSLRMESSLSAQRALDALLSAPAPAPVPTPAAAPAPLPMGARANTSPVTPPVAQTPTAAAATAASATAKPHTSAAAANTATTSTSGASDGAPVVQRQQQAGGDAMAQAQTLWNAGSHDAAIDLMQQSIAAAERSSKTAGNPAGSTVLVALVREMTRMQLAEGRHGAVWELLTRLEPLLGNQPDLWAIRANAAQRLGRHQDSVHAYMMALQSRPDEPRWLLGTAVSLAALGQTSSAAEMAERARTLAPVSKEILAYLRQAGVTLRDPQ